MELRTNGVMCMRTILCKTETSNERMSKYNIPNPLSNLIKLLVLMSTIFGCICSAHAVINPQTTIDCLLRQYTFHVSKDVTVNGKILECSDDITVYSCWGRCDSYEFGDYKIPYRISYHPVCTYAYKRSRLVRLRDCHPEHPDPTYEVFDATACRCRLCNPDYTSCENLNG